MCECVSHVPTRLICAPTSNNLLAAAKKSTFIGAKSYLDLGRRYTQHCSDIDSSRIATLNQSTNAFLPSVCWRWMLFAVPISQTCNIDIINSFETAIVTLSSIIIEWNSDSRKKNFCLRAIVHRVDLLLSWHFFSSICLLLYVWLFSFIQWYFGASLPPRISFIAGCCPMLTLNSIAQCHFVLCSPSRWCTISLNASTFHSHFICIYTFHPVL